jgi:hypothetical protein
MEEQDDVAAARQASGSFSNKIRALGREFGPVMRQILTPSWVAEEGIELEKAKHHGYCVGLSTEQVDEVIQKARGGLRDYPWPLVREALTDMALRQYQSAEGKERSDPS